MKCDVCGGHPVDAGSRPKPSADRNAAAIETASALAGGGVDHVLETGGLGTLNQPMIAAGYGGEIGLVGVMAQGGNPNPRLLMGKSASLRAVSVGSRAMAERLNRAIDASRLKPPIDRTFGFEKVREAYAYQSSPDLFGKIVIRVA